MSAFGCREVQLDDELMGVVHWVANPLGEYPRLRSGLCESVEGGSPGRKVADCVLDAQREHVHAPFGLNHQGVQNGTFVASRPSPASRPARIQQ